MFPLLVHFVRAFFLDELAFRRWIRGALFAFAGSGLTFAEQLAAVIEAPHSVKTIRVVAVVAMFVGGSIQSSAAGKGEQLRDLPPPRGFSPVPLLVLLFAIAGGMILSLSSCASSSQSSGAFKATGSDKSTEHDVASEKSNEHDQGGSVDATVSHREVRKTQAPRDTYTRKLRPDGSVASETFSHDGPVQTDSSADKHADVKSQLERDAQKLFGDDRQHDDLSNYESEGVTETKKAFAPSMGCALFAGGGFFLVFGVAFVGWRILRKSKVVQAAEAVAQAAGVPIP